MPADQSLSTKALPDDAGKPKPNKESQAIWAPPLFCLPSYPPYRVAYVSVCQGSALKKLWSIMMFATQRIVSAPGPCCCAPVKEDRSPMTPFASMALWKNIRPASTALFQNAALAASKQAHT